MSGFRDGGEDDGDGDGDGGLGVSGEPEHLREDGDETVERSVEDIVENVRMTEKHKSFLRCIFDYDGRVPISKIKDKTGLSQDEANSRFRKWSNEEFNLIDVEKLSPEESGKPTGERVAVLNERGERAIQQGLIGDVFDTEETEVRRVFGGEDVEDFEEMKEEVSRLANVVERLQSSVDGQVEDNERVREKVDDVEDDVLRLVDKVGELQERVERVESEQGLDELDGLRSRVEALEGRVDTVEEDVSVLEASFEEFREKVREHLVSAEAYMKGIRWSLEDVLEERVDVDLELGTYIQRVKNS